MSLKKYATSFSKIVALTYVAFPFLFCVYILFIFDVPAVKLAQILLSPLFYFVALWVVLTGYGLWEMLRWTWYVLLPSQILIAYESAVIVANYSESQTKVLSLAMTLALLVFITFRIKAELRVPYFHPRIPWWEMYPGTRMHIAVEVLRITKAQSPVVPGWILDLSHMGAFIKSPQEFLQDEKLKIRFTIHDHQIEAPGVIVWRAPSSVTHPKGIGIKFFSLDKTNRRKLRVVLSRMKKEHRETLADAK